MSDTLIPKWPTEAPDADTLIRYFVGAGLAANTRDEC